MSDYTGNYLVYINGIEIPTEEVSVQGGIWSIPTATIALAPHRSIARLGAEDRVQVAIFYLDQYYEPGYSKFKLLMEGEIVGWQYIKRGIERTILLNVISHISIFTQLFLYFIGNVSTQGFYSSARFESSNPSVIRVATFYPSAFFYEGIIGHKLIKRPFDFIENIIAAIFGTAQVSKKTTNVYDKSKNLYKQYTDALSLYLNKKITDIQEAFNDNNLEIQNQTKELLDKDFEFPISDYVENESSPIEDPSTVIPTSSIPNNHPAKYTDTTFQQYLEYVKQKTEERKKKKRPIVKRSVIATNFFLRWMLLVKFMDHFIAAPYFEDSNIISRDGIFPILRALQRKEGVDALIKLTGAKSGAQNIWKMLQQAFGLVFYELAMICAPPAVIVNRDSLPISPIEPNLYSLSENELSDKFKAMGKNEERMRIGSFITKPVCLFSLPPSCNVFFPCMYGDAGYNYQEDYSKQPTRLYMSASKDARSYGPAGLVNNIKSLKVSYPMEVDKKSIEQGINTIVNEHEHLIWPEEYFRGPVIDSRKFPDFLRSIAEKVLMNKNKRKGDPDEINPEDVYTINHSATTPDELEQNKDIIRAMRDNVEQKIQWFKRMENEKHKEILRDALIVQNTELTKTIQPSLNDDQAHKLTKNGFEVIELIDQSKTASSIQKLRMRERAKQLDAPDEFLDEIYSLGSNKKQTQKTNTKQSNPGSANAIEATDAKKKEEDTTKQIKKAVTKQSLYDLFFDYARQEYFREKYQHRTLELTSVFNPYPIAGFPAFVFDDPSVGLHLAGTLISWSHTLSNVGSTGSSFVISFCRTFDEFFEDIVHDNLGLDAGPAESVKEIRDQLQKVDNARKFYQRLLYQNADIIIGDVPSIMGDFADIITMSGTTREQKLQEFEQSETFKDPVADWTKIIGWATDTVEGVEKIITDPKNPKFNMQYNRDTTPLQKNLFEDLKSALAYTSRPVCTLQDYITFYQGIRGMPQSLADFPITIPNDLTDDFIYYIIIRKFKPWNGEFADPIESNKKIFELPDSRRDWQKTLLYYRSLITGSKIQNFTY